MDDLLLAMVNDIEKVVSSVGDIYTETIKEYVQNYVYDPYTPKMYERTNEFHDSWIFKYQRRGLSIDGEIFSDPEKMNYDPPIHGSGGTNVYEPLAFADFGGGEDRRDIMSQIVAEGTDYDYLSRDQNSNWWTKPRDYWTPAIGEIDGTINSVIRNQFKKFKLNVV